MLSRRYRFHGLGSLKRVYQHGRTVRSPMLSLKYLANDRRHEFRAAVVISRKVNKSAVARNRLRRRIFEQIRLQADNISAFDLVFTVFNEQLGQVTPAGLEQLVLDLLQQAGVLRPRS